MKDMNEKWLYKDLTKENLVVIKELSK
jgi:hypothetical protein